MRWVLFGGGVLFGLTVFNPNFTARRSWYVRKMAPFVLGVVGYNLGQKFYADQVVMTYLRMNDYFPLEVKRALRDKDFRHLALFNADLEKNNR